MEKSNSYIFIYSVVMVVIIATLLSVAAFSLKPAQQANMKIEKMQNILSAVDIQAEASEAEKLFGDNMTEFFFVKAGSSEKVAGNIDEYISNGTVEEGNLPVIDINNCYVIPLKGNGLWGKIWGYISVSKTDGSTVVGTVFDHESETAGLGAEIVKPKFRDTFKGKQVFVNNEFTSVKVVKGGASAENEVDAISGSTKTCDGVTAMLFDCLQGYATFLQSSNAPAATVEEAPAADTVSNVQSLN
ncbi:MAG: FMN-binding protein [Bacteroidales bacterium]|nr:FMN-binding protein [Bacteroidales bacterium]